MRFKDVFSIIGPAMVGPSSSHTAGAVRLGRVARQLLGKLPERAEITFYGSFAETYRGHGTDLAIVSGLMDYDTGDPRIPEAFVHAEKLGIAVTFKAGHSVDIHPNTAAIALFAGDRQLSMTGASIGGGNVEILRVDDFDVRFTGMYPALLVYHDDRQGMIADVTQMLSRNGINIGYMDVDRKGRSAAALTVVETDGPIPPHVLADIRQLPDVRDLRVVDLNRQEAAKG